MRATALFALLAALAFLSCSEDVASPTSGANDGFVVRFVAKR